MSQAAACRSSGGQYSVTTESTSEPLWQRLVPIAAGAMLIVAFSALGLWQLDRAAEKEATAALFEADGAYRTVEPGETPALYERLEVRGRLLGERQVLIDNIVRDGRIGYFVITPLELTVDKRLLLVNRGWIAKQRNGESAADLSVGADWQSLRGRAGRLPRVGIRPGPAFAEHEDWPRTAVYPTIDDVAVELNADLWPFVLLLDADDSPAFRREWQPEESGPMTHYGYAFQWFAMALAVVVIGGWQLKKRYAA